MCYYTSLTKKGPDIVLRFGIKFFAPESYHPMFSVNAFTYPEIPVISSEDPQNIVNYHWGLIPGWVKDRSSAEQIRQNTLNARSETIFEKPSFRHAIRKNRCLILADGFYEWRHIGKATYPYYIQLKTKEPFAIAGIWEAWTDRETNETLKTCSVITTTANPLLEKIHNTRKRMPVILTRENEQHWLDPDLTEARIKEMLVPYPAKDMIAHPVAKTVNKLGLNTSDASVLSEHEYPELPDL